MRPELVQRLERLSAGAVLPGSPRQSRAWKSVHPPRFPKYTPGTSCICTIYNRIRRAWYHLGFSSVQVKDKLPNIFECQLRLWTQWFESWREDERNHFLHMLEEQDPGFVHHFYRSVAGTAGRD